MLTMTDRAGSYLIGRLEQCQAPANAVFRLIRGEDGLELALDSQSRAEDTILEHDERTVLVVDGEIAGTLSGRTVDVQQRGEGVALVLKEHGGSEGSPE